MADNPIIKESNTGNKGTNGDKGNKGSAKQSMVKPLGKIEINMIEHRLTLPHGTLRSELGSVLANRFGTALKRHDRATTSLAYLSDIKDDEKRKKATIEATQLLEASKKEYREEIMHYTNLAMEYIVKGYGKEQRDPMGNIVKYGDKIKVTKDEHLRKIW